MKRLSIPRLAWRNLRMQKGQSIVMVLLLLILVATMFTSRVLTQSMRGGLQRATDRVGADLIFVPQAYESNLRSALFLGEPSTISCDRSALPLVEKLPGVERCSPQLYIATLPASCCSVETQIIAFDPKTDFVVQSWLGPNMRHELKTGEIWVGASILAGVGEHIFFYGQSFDVAGKLERTETGYDRCVFMSFDTAKALFKSQELLKRVHYTDPHQMLSSIMVRVKAGVQPSEVARAFNEARQQTVMKAYTTSDMFSGISRHLRSLASFSDLLMVLLLMMSGLAVICIFTLSILQRKAEFGLLLTVGATTRQLVAIVLAEALMIGLLGALLGVLLPGLTIYLFRFAIAERFGLMDLLFSPGKLLPIVGESVLVALLMGLAAALFALWRLLLRDPYELIREEV